MLIIFAGQDIERKCEKGVNQMEENVKNNREILQKAR
jgi:hypothetical protein